MDYRLYLGIAMTIVFAWLLTRMWKSKSRGGLRLVFLFDIFVGIGVGVALIITSF